jgi:hypothetical protein
VSSRLASAAIAIALVMGLPAGFAAHPEGGERPLGHLHLDVRDLGPGESYVHHVESVEGPLRAGWIYILYGYVEGDGHVIVELDHEGNVTDRFVWTGGGYHHNSTKVRHSGAHDLTLTNPTNATLRYAFYYDQSCNCDGKVIPVPRGFVLFNHDFEAGREVRHALYVYDEAITLRARLATHDKDLATGNWPADFRVLDEQTVDGQAWIEFRFTPPVTQTYYVFYEALRGGSPQDPIVLTPVIEVQDDDHERAPALLAIALVLVLVGAVAIAARRHR